MSELSKKSENDPERGIGATIDLVIALGVPILASVLFAILGGEFQVKAALITLAFMALIMLVARRHGVSVGAYMLRLREKPTDFASSRRRAR